MLENWLPLFRLRPHWLLMISLATALSPSPQPFLVILLVAFTYLNAVYGELANFVHDYPTDLQNPRMQKYAHITGKIKFSSLKQVSVLFLSMSLLTGAALLMAKPGTILLLLILFAVHCGHSYSAPPLRLKRYWWGGTVSYVAYAAVVLLISAAVLDSETTTATTAAAIFFIGSLSVWTLNSIPDEACDRKEGIETPAIRFGAEACVNAYLPLAMLSSALAATIIMGASGSTYAGIPFLLPAALAGASYVRMKKELKKGIEKKTLYTAILHHRYNITLVTLSYLIILNT